MRRIISGSRSVPFLMERFWFNCNKGFSGFGFIFLNPKRIQVLLFPSRLYFKNIFLLFYFIF